MTASFGPIARLAQGLRYAFTGQTPTAWFGPDQPLPPVAPQTAGRRFDYPAGANLSGRARGGEGLPFAELRALADSCDLLRLVIETRKDQMARLTWAIRPRDGEAGTDDPRITAITRFLAHPDRENGWSAWLRMLLEDMLVIDAATLYPRRRRDGGLYALELVDGATIRRLIDERGRTPAAPAPAYQQVLKGVPAADYSRSELFYLPRNLRSHRLYGFGPVEQVAMTVNIALRRQIGQLRHFTEGNIPEALIGVPQNWSPDQIRAFQDYWDSLFEGGGASRRHARFVPGGLSFMPTHEPPLKDDFDEWLARVICFAFSVSPQAFVRQMNRASAETAQQTAIEEGLFPLMQWVREAMNRLLDEAFAAPELEFVWTREDEPDPQIRAAIDQIYLATGVRTINEVRAQMGLEPVAWGDRPMPVAPKAVPHP